MPLPGVETPEQQAARWARDEEKRLAKLAEKKQQKEREAQALERVGGEEAMKKRFAEGLEWHQREGDYRRNRAYDLTHDDEATGIGKVHGTKPAGFKSGDEADGA